VKTLITICARGGSKGLPGKNLAELNGRPLMQYTLDAANAFASKHGAVIGLSTDSEDIVTKAASLGLTTNYRRPVHLATDSAGKIGVIQHLMEYTEEEYGTRFDRVLDLDITSPLRTLQDLEEGVNLIDRHPEAYNLFSVSPASRNPYFNMVEETNTAFVKLVKEGNATLSRQGAPVVYDMNASFYIFNRAFFEEGFMSSITPRSLAYVMNHECFDIDHPRDLKVMELMLQNGLLEFMP